MNLSLIIAAGDNGSGDFVVGLLVGCCIGILVGPAFRSWQIYKEWVVASREADLNGHADPRSHDTAPGSTWQPLP